MKHLERLTRKNLGELLVDEGLITKVQLVDAEQEQRRTGAPLGTILVAANFVDAYDLAKTVSAQYQLPFVDLAVVGRSKAVLDIIPEDDCRFRKIVPIDRIGNVLTMAVAEMPDLTFLKEVKENTGLVPFLFVALTTSIDDILEPEKVAPEAEEETSGEVSEESGEFEDLGAELQAVAAANLGDPAEGDMPEIGPADWEEGLSVLDVEVSADGKKPEKGKDEAENFFAEMEKSGTDWENIFDSANESVLKEIDGD
jgi:hypothetical protein